MYSRPELTKLADCKAELRRTIALRRVENAATITRVMMPVERIDRLVVLWRKTSTWIETAIRAAGHDYSGDAASTSVRTGPGTPRARLVVGLLGTGCMLVLRYLRRSGT